jgi:predicted nucleic acid-binding protein
VVLDTNIVVSALLFAAGPAAQVRRAWQDGRLQPLASRDTVAEVVRVLAYPQFKLTADEQQELLGDYLPYTATVAIPDRRPRPALPPCRPAAMGTTCPSCTCSVPVAWGAAAS